MVRLPIPFPPMGLGPAPSHCESLRVLSSTFSFAELKLTPGTFPVCVLIKFERKSRHRGKISKIAHEVPFIMGRLAR